MLASLLAANPAESIHVHLLHDESLPSRDLDSLRAIVLEAGGSFDPLPVHAAPADVLLHSERFSLNAWYRVLLAELLPDLGRVLYIDSDALITGRLDVLWETDLTGYVLGAITNPLYATMVPRIRSKLGLPDRRYYFNSGVLLIDLGAWRAESTTEAIFEFARGHPGLWWPDQDALNGVLYGRRRHLHPRWNALPQLWELRSRSLPYPAHEVREAKSNPAIVHFLGPYKPWHYRSRHVYRGEYFRYLEQTPWRRRPTEGRTARHAVLRALPPRMATRYELAEFYWKTGMRPKALRRSRAMLGRMIGRRSGIYAWLRRSPRQQRR